LEDEEVGLLIETLARLDVRDGEALADQIAALRLAGGEIRLAPTEAEIAALNSALSVLVAEAQPFGPALGRLASMCAVDGATGETPPV
jgi:hypothetical protein